MKKRLVVRGIPALLAAVAGLAVFATGALNGIERQSLDARYRIRGDKDPNPGIQVVALDPGSFAVLDRPQVAVPRSLHARALHNLLKLDPRLVVYDISFDNPGDRADDRALFDAIREGGPKVVLGINTVTGTGKPAIAWGAGRVGETGAGLGALVFKAEPDGVYRAFVPAVKDIPTLPVESADALGEAGPPDEDARYPIDYAGPSGTYHPIPFWRAVQGKLSREQIEGQIVFVGVTASSFQDEHPTPFGPQPTPGVEIQANALATALAGYPLREVPDAIEIALIGAMAFVGAVLWFGTWKRLLLAPVALAALLVAVQLAFNAGHILELIPSVVSFSLAFVGTGTTELIAARAERRRARENLMRFAPPSVADELMAGGKTPKLGGAELDATVLFVDLSGFTTFGEKHEAALVIDALNVYLGGVSEVIRDHEGTVVAFLGDGVMAVFGAPVQHADHAGQAVRAAADMEHRVLRPFETWLRQRGVDDEVGLGVGVASGPVMSGLVGTDWRTEYAAVGDTTNVAARLQGEAKKLGLCVLLTEATRERMASGAGLREVGEVSVKGRDQPLRVWTIDTPSEPVSG